MLSLLAKILLSYIILYDMFKKEYFYQRLMCYQGHYKARLIGDVKFYQCYKGEKFKGSLWKTLESLSVL